ncbi:hypothetical protein, partial [Pantoea septica]|uniref:hypothetical protein n=1 Tax=Pantoea septica TaxID=472695 RepID=UPI0028A9546A
AVVPCRWRRIIGSRSESATAKLQKNDRSLHSTAKARLIRDYPQSYPQCISKRIFASSTQTFSLQCPATSRMPLFGALPEVSPLFIHKKIAKLDVTLLFTRNKAKG